MSDPDGASRDQTLNLIWIDRRECLQRASFAHCTSRFEQDVSCIASSAGMLAQHENHDLSFLSPRTALYARPGTEVARKARDYIGHLLCTADAWNEFFSRLFAGSYCAEGPALSRKEIGHDDITHFVAG